MTCRAIGCFWSCAARDEADAADATEKHENNNCPNRGAQTRLSRGALMTILSDLWSDMDAQLDAFLVMPAEDPRKEYSKGVLRGMAAAIAKISKPYIKDGDEVARIALNRRNARTSGEPYITPGLENITIFPEEPTKWYPAPGGFTSNPGYASVTPAGYPPSRVAAGASAPAGTPAAPAPGRTPRGAPSKSFTPEEVTKIRATHAAGFDVKMLASAYKCTEANINAVLNG